MIAVDWHRSPADVHAAALDALPPLVDVSAAMREMTWVVREAGRLIQTRPGPDTPDVERDAWEHRRGWHAARKARLLARIETDRTEDVR